MNNTNSANMNGNDEINLLELFDIVIRKLKQIVFVSILCGIAAFLVSVFLLTPKYTSSVELYVTNVSYQNTQVNDSVNANDITASQKLLATYKVLLQTDEAYNLFKASTGIELTKKQLLEMIEFSSLESTEILEITATTEDPYLSADICNGFAAIAPTLIKDIFNGGSVRVLGVAKPSGVPTSPNTTLYTIAGFIAGFGIAAVAYILLEMFTNNIKGEQELGEKCNVPVIGSVPDFFSIRELRIPRSVRKANKKLTASNTNAKLLTDYTILSKASPFVVTEAYNMIRTNLAFSLSTSSGKTIVISSSLPNECKSTTSVNLAISVANTGKQVLLIDGDLRNPTLHRIFKKSNKRGLSRVLAGIDTTGEAIVRNVRPGLDLLLGGSIPPNPSELLGSERMGSLLRRMSVEYDYVIIDSPPINVVADAMLLSKHAAGIIMVAREGVTKYNDLSKALSKVELTKCNLLGVILTDSKRMSSGYGDYRYGYGYGSAPEISR